MTAGAVSPGAPGRGSVAGDAWGGLAAMLVALPSSIAFGVAIYGLLGAQYVGRGARAGILGAIAIGIVAPMLGGAPRLISAPCAPAAAVVSALAASLLAGGASPAHIVVLLLLMATMSGALQLLYGALGGGRLIKYIPYPVVSGYLSGVGVLIFLSQVPKLLGFPAGVSLRDGLLAPGVWQAPAVVVGLVTIGGVVVAPYVTRSVPATIVGLGSGLIAYLATALARPELLSLDGNRFVIGPFGGSIGAILADLRDSGTALRSLGMADVGTLVVPALTLSVLLSIDTLKTCVAVDAITRSRHDSNRELRAQGVGNLLAAFVGGVPGAGTMGATLVNVTSGGRTRLSGMLEGLFVLAAFLLLGGFIAWVPIAALAGILVVVAYRMCDWRSVHLLRQRSTALDFVVIAAVVVVAVEVDLIAASGTGLALAILLFIREQIRGSVIRRKVTGRQMSSKQHRLPAEEEALDGRRAEITICELQGSLFFGTTDQLFTELEGDLERCRFLILDMRRVNSVDYTAAHLLEQFEAILGERDGFLLFSRLPPALPTGQDLKKYFAQVGVMRPKKNVLRFETLDDALQWAEDRILGEVRPGTSDEEAPLELPQVELLREFEADGTLGDLARCVETRSLAAGELVFRAGDRGDELFLIRRGVVRIVLPLEGGDYHNLAACGRGDFFGEMTFLDRGVRSADAVATTATDLYVISRARFDELARAHALVGVKLFARLARALARRLRRTDAELRAMYES